MFLRKKLLVAFLNVTLLSGVGFLVLGAGQDGTAVADSEAVQVFGGCPNLASPKCGTQGVNGCNGYQGFGTTTGASTSQGKVKDLCGCGGSCGSVYTDSDPCGYS